MKSRLDLKTGFLVVALLLNLRFVLPWTVWSARLYAHVRGLSLTQRRYLLYPSLYPEILKVQQTVPRNATFWVVSPIIPSHINYLLYPHILRYGSNSMQDLDAVRARHRQDFILTHASADPQNDHLTIYPPLDPL